MVCVRRAVGLQRVWKTPALVGSEFVACADRLQPNDFIDPNELALLAECLVPGDVYVQSLVACA